MIFFFSGGEREGNIMGKTSREREQKTGGAGRAFGYRSRTEKEVGSRGQGGKGNKDRGEGEKRMRNTLKCKK